MRNQAFKDIDHKIPPHLPLPKGGITPLWKRGARGDFIEDVCSILRLSIGPFPEDFMFRRNNQELAL